MFPSQRTTGYQQVPPPLRSSQPAADYDGFFAAVGEALALHRREQAIPANWNLNYVEEYPRSKSSEGFDHSFDVVTFKVVSSAFAGVDRTGKGTIPKSLRRFHSQPHPTKARYHLVTEGWQENVVAEFQVLSKSNQTANQMAIWFHRFLLQYAYSMRFFQSRGIENFVFVERLEDDVTKEYGQDLNRRRLRYAFRLAFLVTYESKDLESIHVEVRQDVFSGAESPTESFDWSLDDGPKPQG